MKLLLVAWAASLFLSQVSLADAKIVVSGASGQLGGLVIADVGKTQRNLQRRDRNWVRAVPANTAPPATINGALTRSPSSVTASTTVSAG
jgi:hypothetical protein